MHIYQFSDSAIRTVSRKSRVTKQFSSCVISLAYIDNKVFVSLKNGELAIFRRHFSIWNYDNYTVTSIAQNPFNCMLTVAGKLWCSSSNKIIVLSPTLVSIDVRIPRTLNMYRIIISSKSLFFSITFQSMATRMFY